MSSAGESSNGRTPSFGDGHSGSSPDSLLSKTEKTMFNIAECARKWREKQKELGLCMGCKEKALPGKTRCAKHTDDNNRRTSARHRKLNSEGKCKACGKEPKDGKKLCEECSQKNRARSLDKLYRITQQEYERILEYQHGLCFICGHPPKKKRLAVDHNHKTGLIRGLLCAGCNVALGKFRDDPDRIRKAMAYVDAPPATIVLGAPRYGIVGRINNSAKTMKRLQRRHLKLEAKKAASSASTAPSGSGSP